MSELTENTLPRYYAKEIECIWCGCIINKKEVPHYFKTIGNGDLLRVWNCPNCHNGVNGGFYSENITKLRELGIE